MAPIALGRSAATAIAIDDSDDDQSAPAAPEAILVILSSDDEGDVDDDSTSVRSVNVLDVSAWGGSEVTSRRKRRAPPRPRAASAVPVRPRSPAPSVVVLDGPPSVVHKKTKERTRSQAPSAVSAPAASAKGRDAAASRRKKANKEPRRLRSPAPSFVSLGSPPVVDSSAADPAPSANGGNHEATSLQKRTQTSWAWQDELTLLATMAKIRRDNGGVLETGSPLLQKLLEDGEILRISLRATELSSKVRQLKKKFISAVAAGYEGSGNVAGGRNYRSPRQYHNSKLYEKSKEVWPELLPAAAQEHSRDNGGATTSSQQPSSSSNHFI